jgi:two-component system, OmpR family, alkaline phosphatase synthesis response regulator PhoP
MKGDTAHPRILVVEDDQNTLRLITLYLENDGYAVFPATRGDEALQRARELLPDLIVLDLMIPGIDGLEVCKIVREEFNPFIIMLTARTTEQDKLIGLDAGADDYVAKPFSPRELAARVRAVLRRSEFSRTSRPSPDICVGELCVNLAEHSVRRGHESITLTPIEFRLLAILLSSPGRTFTREELIDRALGYDYDGIDRTIDAHIKNIRRKIETNRTQPRFIRTVFGVGYVCPAEGTG